MTNRRRFLGQAAALGSLAHIVDRAAAVPPARQGGSLHDVQHIVVLMQENRSFDHYFGALNGVRGFADPFPLPQPGGRTVWMQPREQGEGFVLPFHLDTRRNFALMRAEGTPHTWPDAQEAWDHGRMGRWPAHKHDHTMAHYAPADLPLQRALADAFTLCDAYHCSFQGGTHPNRYFLMTGTNGPSGRGHGPALYNDYDDFGAAAAGAEGFTWTTYAERLQAAGVSWFVYQDLADNFGDNSLAGFRLFRDAFHHRPGLEPALAAALRERAASSGGLERLQRDVLADRLPQVSWIVGTAEGSEHPWTSSPVQGADYTLRVLQALSANPAVWARTVLFVNYDENDGFFDHMPPPAPPSLLQEGSATQAARWAGSSGAETLGEYHVRLDERRRTEAEQALLMRPYGLGPRVPMFVVSPFSRGGHVCSQVFDHTSVIRFMEARFGVAEPNISPWRRAVCGDLTAAFDFGRRDPALPAALVPDIRAEAARGRALPRHTKPVPPPASASTSVNEKPGAAPVQPPGPRPARALPYAVAASARVEAASRTLQLRFVNRDQALVLHAVDRLRLEALPRRHTLAAQQRGTDSWPLADDGRYDLWLLGPNGWHRHWLGQSGESPQPEASAEPTRDGRWLQWELHNPGPAPRVLTLQDQAYGAAAHRVTLAPRQRRRLRLPLPGHRWYDWVLRCEDQPGWLRRAAGHAENGRPSITDPAMHGPAVLQAWDGRSGRGVAAVAT